MQYLLTLLLAGVLVWVMLLARRQGGRVRQKRRQIVEQYRRRLDETLAEEKSKGDGDIAG